jgi:hypothetical protein
MQSYIPLFSEIVDSSVWKEPEHVRIVFVTLLALKDWDHVVRLPLHKIGNKANVGDEKFLDAMKILSEPDRFTSIPQPFDGRRIREVDGGWLILNGQYYQDLMRQVNQRARWSRQKRAQRARLNTHKGPISGELAYQQAFDNGAEDGELNRLTDRSAEESLECRKEQREQREQSERPEEAGR